MKCSTSRSRNMWVTRSASDRDDYPLGNTRSFSEITLLLARGASEPHCCAMGTSLPIRTFDAADDVTIVERRNLPHWNQAATLTFITWRTWDSIPRPVMAAWLRARADWLSARGIDVADSQ